MPVPKYACQTRLTIDRAVVGERRSASQRANVSRVGGAVRGQRLQEARHARRHGPLRLEEIASLAARGSSAAFRVHSSTNCDAAFGMLPPERFDRVVGLFPLGNRRPPVAEDRGNLGRRPLFPRDRQDLADVLRQRIGRRVRRVGDRQAEAAQIVVLIVVAVPAAVLLAEGKRQHRAAGKGDRFLRDKDGLTRLVAAAGTDVDAPGRFVVAIDGEAIGPVTRRRPLLSSKIASSGVSGGLTSAVACTISTGTVFAGASSGAAVTLELGQRARPLDRAARTVERQIRIVEQLEPKGGDVRHRRLHANFADVLRRRIALREDRAVGQQVMLLSAGNQILRSRPDDGPDSADRCGPSLPSGPSARANRDARCRRPGFDLVDLAEEVGSLSLFVGRVDGDVRLVVVVEEREHPVILFLRERIVLVVVALGALDRQAEDALADRVHAVEHGLHPELLGIDAPFFVEHRVAQKTRGDDLVLRRMRQLVAGDLLDDELIVGQVAIQGADDPVAIEPDLPRLVLFVAVGVGIARGVEPDPPPALAVVRRRQQPVDLPRIRTRRWYRPERRRPRRSSAATRSRRETNGGAGRSCPLRLRASVSPARAARRTKRSIALRDQPPSLTTGTAGSLGGT